MRRIEPADRFKHNCLTAIASAILAFLIVPWLFTPADGKAYYAPSAEMIRSAEIIALVEITKVNPVAVQGSHWTYSQEAEATVERVIKGKLFDPADPGKARKSIKLFGGENFECARCNLVPGHFLVFLRHDGQLLVGSNWHLGIRPVRNGKVEWYKECSWSPGDMKQLPLKDVLNEIEKGLSMPAKKDKEE